MNEIILCDGCKTAKSLEDLCEKCTFYITHYCRNCNEESKEICMRCKEARDFLENDDKRQASAERTDRNYIVHISVEYAESNKLLIKEELDILDTIINLKQNEKTLEAFNCLTDKQRKRFALYYFEGKTLVEIGEEEGVEYQTIQKSLNKSRKKLKKFLQRGV